MNRKSLKKGFTLIEMMVSLAIFSVVALISVGALVRIMDANQKSISLKTSINNLNYALEAMTREMRMGSVYRCDTAASNGNNSNIISGGISAQSCSNKSDWMIAFKSSKRNLNNNCNLVFAYKYIDQTIYKAEQPATDTDCNVLHNGSFYPIISADTKITASSVTVDSVSVNQPIIRIYINGENGIKERNKTKFSLQTTISQRLPKY
jgi:prepilin-type N-terminal cleavage/methylation domain-containing protein